MIMTQPGSTLPSASRAEFGLAIAIALVYWTDILWLVFPGETGAPSSTFRLTMLCIYAVVGLLLYRRVSEVFALVELSPMLTGLLLLPLISGYWSIAPTETFNRAIALLGSSAFAHYLVSAFSSQRLILIVSSASTLAALLSAALIFAVPSMGVMPDGEYIGAWRGAYSHKNAFGFMTSLGAVACLIGWRGLARPLCYISLTGFALNLLLLAGTRSLSSQVNVLASIFMVFTAAWFVSAIYRHGVVLSIGATLIALTLVSTVTMYDVSNMLANFGKDLTLSARMPLWELIIPFAKDRLWLGYGYDAFWSEGHYAVDIITQRMRFNPAYSHNGLLELWLSLGLLGIGLFLAVFAQYLYRAFVLLNAYPKDPVYLFGLVFGFLLVIGNINEATLLQRNSMAWILFVLLALLLARARVGTRVADGASPSPINRSSSGGKLLVR
jgi:exopolysaccharide production protein ExoQ